MWRIRGRSVCSVLKKTAPTVSAVRRNKAFSGAVDFDPTVPSLSCILRSLRYYFPGLYVLLESQRSILTADSKMP